MSSMTFNRSFPASVALLVKSEIMTALSNTDKKIFG